ncbi:iron-siderophore ABC transporter substrate-binding protein [Cryptosporangium sp. NPDC051539]|uniref:iron-siderophore ABC transporter substrate-binding protein n=1 Tax=Cryptosporangium sp. NPDC051539 TaxID=3363962 RepID=UPI0037A977EB
MKKRTLVQAALSLALGVALVGCSGDDAATTTTPSVSSSGSAFPVTIAHKYGSTTIPRAPERVVTLGLSDQDAVLALGTVPVGAVDWFGEKPFGNWPWVKDKWTTAPTIVGERDDYDVEKIIGLKPDLILAQYSGMTQAQYTTLSKIAPVVAQIKEFPDYSAPWQDMATVIGKSLGREPEMDKILTGIDDQLARVKKDNPEWANQTAVVVDPSEPGMYAAFAESDPKAQLIRDMGFKLSPEVTKLAGKDTAAVLSAERLDVLDVDRLVLLTTDATVRPRVEKDPAFAALKVVREKRTTWLPYTDAPPVGGALTFVTPLSVPWAIDQLVSMLNSNG